MKKSSLLINVLAITCGVLLIIGIGLGIAIGFDAINATSETTSLIKLCCASGIVGLAIAAVVSGKQYQPSNSFAS